MDRANLTVDNGGHGIRDGYRSSTSQDHRVTGTVRPFEGGRWPLMK
jgi:hypothetical protein